VTQTIYDLQDSYYEKDNARLCRVGANYLQDEQVLVHFDMTKLLSDHPVGLGGAGLGPSPGELLLASLAACTAIFVGRNAKLRGIPVESVYVGTAFTAAGEDVDGQPLPRIAFLDRITKYVEVRGPLTPEQFEEIKYFVEHCAIGETLQRGVELDEQIVHITDPSAPPLQGHLPGSAGVQTAAFVDCCSGGECEVPVAEELTTSV
jgi:putative redox protein